MKDSVSASEKLFVRVTLAIVATGPEEPNQSPVDNDGIVAKILQDRLRVGLVGVGPRRDRVRQKRRGQATQQTDNKIGDRGAVSLRDLAGNNVTDVNR